ncbi:MAG: hypothetical protein JXQ83_03525, partial [Candidatus Glassbacteria bacterium]|nr:hypothetical protein [Candidatus Glassbacteria bacterium]
LWVCAGTSFFLLVFNPLLGIRDWDLLCLPAVPLALAAGLALARVLPGAGGKAFLRTLALAAAAHAATWVWINSDISRGVQFLDRVAEADCHLDTGKFTLASMLHERGFFRKAIRQYRLVESSDRFKMQKSRFNLGNCFFNLEMPDSIIFYLSGFEKGYMVSAVVKDYDMILSLAWDMKCRSDSATSYFLAPRRLGLELDEAHRTKWAEMMTRLADCYEKKLLQDPADIDAQLFFLRLYTLKREDDKLADVYQRLLAHYYSLEQWNRLLQFADLCGHRVYLEKMLSEALAQHPEAARRPDVSP